MQVSSIHGPKSSIYTNAHVRTHILTNAYPHKQTHTSTQSPFGPAIPSHRQLSSQVLNLLKFNTMARLVPGAKNRIELCVATWRYAYLFDAPSLGCQQHLSRSPRSPPFTKHACLEPIAQHTNLYLLCNFLRCHRTAEHANVFVGLCV